MTDVSLHAVRCGTCQQDGSVELYTSLNVTERPELRALIMNDTLNLFQCAGCGARLQFIQSVFYADTARGFGIWHIPGLTEADYCAFLEAHQSGPLPALTATWDDFKRTIALWETHPAQASHAPQMRPAQASRAPRPRAPRLPEFALEALDSLRAHLQLDADWTDDGPEGFTCWAGPLAQWFRIEACDGPAPCARLCVHTDLLRGWADTPPQQATLAPLLEQTTLSALARDPDNPSCLRLTSSLILREDNWEWLAEWMGWIASVQAAEAHTLAEPLAAMTGAQAAVSAHPRSGPRAEVDPALEIDGRVLLPAGTARARWQGRDFIGLLKHLPCPPCLSSRAGPRSLTAEFACGPGISRVHFRADAPHRLGSGLSVELTVPRPEDANEAQWVSDALALNDRSLRAPLHVLGSWRAAGAGEWTYSAFIPNALYTPTALRALVEDGLARVRWAITEILGHLWHDGPLVPMGAR